ncbi:MAG TPA: prolipoprotein diacylglyceryl transferase family protein, partial [Candidatus Acidoferrales bacterium]|nr:prolipoprotein diacylglyceryl transferase family protein [Candidatus Acidoferrales bacterium]
MYPFIHIGPLTLGTYGLLVASGLLCALLVLRADLRRRCLDADPHTIIGFTGLAGLAGSKLWHALESPAELFAHPFAELFSPLGFAFYGAFVGGFVALVLLARHYRMPFAEMLDVA